MAEGPGWLGKVLDESSRSDARLRDILELSLKAGLEDEEARSLLGPETLGHALEALAAVSSESKPEPSFPDWTAADGLSPRRETEPDNLVLGIREYAAAVAQLLRHAEGEVAIALFGDWGIGKTTLANAVEDELRKPPRAYEIVRFSAWQYRKPPETWIFLYETFVRSYLRRTLPIWQRYARTLRVGAARHGVLNLALVLCALGLALLAASLSDWKASLGSVAVLVAAAPTLWTRVREPARRLASRYGAIAQHADRLGMQATIGDDMRALLRAWQPDGVPQGGTAEAVRKVALSPLRHVIVPPSPDGAGETAATFAPPLLKAGALGTLMIAVSWIIALLFPHKLPLAVASAILLCLWAGLCALCWIALLQLPADAERILLVVDDLDRCEPDEAMTIIEAVKLLLDDPEMQRRVQVLMLADERTFAVATTAKFQGLIAERAAAIQAEREEVDAEKAAALARLEVIREHREKLFLRHLRLGPLSSEEAADLGYRFSRPPVAAKTDDGGGTLPKLESSPAPPPQHQSPLSDPGERLAASAGAGSPPAGTGIGTGDGTGTQPLSGISESMTDDEALLLKAKLAALKPSRQITPRNIRSLIQLARNLVRAGSRQEGPDPVIADTILTTLIAGTFGDIETTPAKNPSARGAVSYVIAQVS